MGNIPKVTLEDNRIILIGAICGVAAVLCYFSCVSNIFSDLATMLCAFAFGPMLIVGFSGYYRYCQLYQHRTGPQIALIFGIVAMALFTLMVVVQVGNWMVHADLLAEAVTETAIESANVTMNAVNRVQFLTDVAMDIFICLATILFGYAFLRQGMLDKILGAIWGLLGLVLLILNIAAFPYPPDSVGSFDAGPLLGVWFLVISIRVLIFAVKHKRSE